MYKLSDYLMPFGGINPHTADRLLWGFRLPVHYLECVGQSNAADPFSAKSNWTVLILLHSLSLVGGKMTVFGWLT